VWCGMWMGKIDSMLYVVVVPCTTVFSSSPPMTCKEGGRKVQAKAFNFFGSSQATIIGVGIAVSSLVCPQDTSLSE